MNDGTRDIGSSPTQILLLRGLDPLTTEEELVLSLSQIPGKVGQDVSKKGVRRVFVVRDRASRSSWGYAFVQFADVQVGPSPRPLSLQYPLTPLSRTQLATSVLSSAIQPRLYPTGFRLRSSIVSFSFSHENSFVPVYAKSEWSFKGEGGMGLSYWDDKAFVSPWMPKEEAKKMEKEKEDADVEAFLSQIEKEMPATLVKQTTTTTATTNAPPAMMKIKMPGMLITTPAVAVEAMMKASPSGAPPAVLQGGG